ncbi:MAG: ATP-binding protein [Eubacterium sp.]|nr:ATP-binding protein [Eubacterium sp.]
MSKKFNITGLCIPERDYMADISGKLDTIIKQYIRQGRYFTINRARQYGKTTILYLLEQKLADSYLVIHLSFEASDEMFVSLYTLAVGFLRKITRLLRQQNANPSLLCNLNEPISEQFPLDDLSERITCLCRHSEKEIILMIDEVDKSSDNQIFLSFLGLLRAKYLAQMQKKDYTFQSVILAGVYDIKNLKLKLHPEQETKYNSPWNIAADFMVDLSLKPEEISAMLLDYEKDHATGMDISAISRLIYDYTSGYPYLASRICQIADERLPAAGAFAALSEIWTQEGIAAAEQLLRKEPNPLFDDLVKKITDFPKLKQMLQDILFCGSSFPYEYENHLIQLGTTFGFLKESQGNAVIANRIFETKLYDLFLSEIAVENTLYQSGSMERNQYIVHGSLQMKLVMEKFCEHFTEIYGTSDASFVEAHGRKLFLLYLKPIINGTGNYYIEAQTRDQKRTDIIVDYHGTRHIIELKIWHGNEYHKRGEQQLLEYLNYYHTDTGYLLSFNFNEHKKTGMQEIILDGKHIYEVTV